jgi:hypothetical protein
MRGSPLRTPRPTPSTSAEQLSGSTTRGSVLRVALGSQFLMSFDSSVTPWRHWAAGSIRSPNHRDCGKTGAGAALASEASAPMSQPASNAPRRAGWEVLPAA